jgi:hypothetical protein
MNVQASIPESDYADNGDFVSFQCLICRQMHFIDKVTGAVMGERKK